MLGRRRVRGKVCGVYLKDCVWSVRRTRKVYIVWCILCSMVCACVCVCMNAYIVWFVLHRVVCVCVYEGVE